MKAALFDLDGVVIDTESQYTSFWSKVGKMYYPEDESFALKLKGQTLTYIYNEFFADKPDARERIRQMLSAFEMDMKYPYVPGAVEYVSALKRKGVPTAIVTSSDRQKMQRLYHVHPELPTLFSGIFTAEDAARSKPAPDCYLNAARRLGVQSSECCVFEDSLNGVKAARAAGTLVVGLSTSNPADALRPLCDMVIADFTNLPKTFLDT